jgi:hypothetical protein
MCGIALWRPFARGGLSKTEACQAAYTGDLPPPSSLVTPRPKETVSLLHTLSDLHGFFPDSQAAHNVLDGVSTMRRGCGHPGSAL